MRYVRASPAPLKPAGISLQASGSLDHTAVSAPERELSECRQLRVDTHLLNTRLNPMTCFTDCWTPFVYWLSEKWQCLVSPGEKRQEFKRSWLKRADVLFQYVCPAPLTLSTPIIKRHSLLIILHHSENEHFLSAYQSVKAFLISLQLMR